MLEQRVLRHLGGVGPGIELVQSEEQRDEEQGQQREDAGGGLQQPADDESPDAAGEVLEHEDGQAAQGDPQPQQVSGEVGAEELRRIDEGADGAGGGGGHTDDHRAALDDHRCGRRRDLRAVGRPAD